MEISLGLKKVLDFKYIRHDTIYFIHILPVWSAVITNKVLSYHFSFSSFKKCSQSIICISEELINGSFCTCISFTNSSGIWKGWCGFIVKMEYTKGSRRFNSSTTRDKIYDPKFPHFPSKSESLLYSFFPKYFLSLIFANKSSPHGSVLSTMKKPCRIRFIF